MRCKCLGDCFQESFLKQGERKAISFLQKGKIETELSFLEIDHDSNQMANKFLDLGVKKSDRVVLYLPKSLGLIVAYLALQKIGAIPVPLNPGFKQSEMSYLFEDTEAKLVISGTDQFVLIKEIDPRLNAIVIDTKKPYQDIDFFRSSSDNSPQVEIKPDDVGLIIYTSGTTGKPKGVMLTQENLIHNTENIIKIWKMSESDLLCHALPLFHTHGLCFALQTALLSGARMLMFDQFSPQHVIEALAKKEGKYVCSIFMAVPSIYRKMIDYLGKTTMDFEHIRLWTSGSAPLLPKNFNEIKKIFGKEPVEREGMSETGMNFSNPIDGTKKPGSIGIPLPDLNVRIVNPETFKDVNTGYIGEIWLKSPAISQGYWKKHRETAATFKSGWFRTGDLGMVDKEGYYYLTDRLKDVIISGGENISPKEIETIINHIEGIIESCVLGVPDEKWGKKWLQR